MTGLKYSLKFSYLKDDTRLVQHGDTLYKVKVTYDQKTFKGRPVMFTTTQLSNQIEDVVGAAVYMLLHQKRPHPLETEHFLVIITFTKWPFPSKYPNYVFKRHDKILDTCDSMIELFVKHVDELYEPEDSEESIQSQTQHLQNQTKQKQTSNKDKDSKCAREGGSRFVRDATGELQRWLTQSVHSKQSSQEENRHVEKKRELRKRTSEKTEENSSHQKLAKRGKETVRKGDKKARSDSDSVHSDTDTTGDHHGKDRGSINNKQTPSRHKEPKPCADCLEEQQFRRRSSRIKSKPESTPEIQRKHLNDADRHTNQATSNDRHTKETNKIDSHTRPATGNDRLTRQATSNERNTRQINNNERLTRQATNYDRNTKQTINNDKHTMQTNSIDRPNSRDQISSPGRGAVPTTDKQSNKERNTEKDHEIRVSPMRTRKRNTSGLNSNNNAVTDPGIKRRKQREASPAAVYRDILQSRNRDRHVVEQLERQETNKLGDLYEVEAPRRSLRQAEKAGNGRLSGLWNRIWDTFFTPKK